MSDQDDWDFASADDAKVTIRTAVRYFCCWSAMRSGLRSPFRSRSRKRATSSSTDDMVVLRACLAAMV